MFCKLGAWARVYKTFPKLNLTEHDIYPGNNVKMPTIVRHFNLYISGPVYWVPVYIEQDKYTIW